MEEGKVVLAALGKEFRNAAIQLKTKPLENAHVLLETDERIRELVRNGYSDIQDAIFLQFFYSYLRYHLWMHIAAEASTRISDESTEAILNEIRSGLESLAESIENDDKIRRYDAMVQLVFNYHNELNRVKLVDPGSQKEIV